jgi:hypothetical protein
MFDPLLLTGLSAVASIILGLLLLSFHNEGISILRRVWAYLILLAMLSVLAWLSPLDSQAIWSGLYIGLMLSAFVVWPLRQAYLNKHNPTFTSDCGYHR